MSILARSFYTYSFFELVNRVCLIQSVSCLSNSATKGSDTTPTPNAPFRSCDFEIFGTVQGVYFRHHTQQQAIKLNLIGWIKNTDSDTVQGHMEGGGSDVDKMKNWLQTTGSPKSKITKAKFTNEKSITQLTGKTFNVKREK